MRLPYQDKRRWRWRWMQREGSVRLHRVKRSFGINRYWSKAIEGETACGLRVTLHMPGLFDRMGALRCGKCCDATKVKRGFGAPYNHGINA